MIGAGGKFFGGVVVPPGGGGGGGVAEVLARNGLSLDPASTLADPIVVLGDDGGGEAAFIDDRFIEMAGNALHFTDGFIDKALISHKGYAADNGAYYSYTGNNSDSFVLDAVDARAGFMRLFLDNTLADASAGVGMLLQNDLGNVFQHYLSSSLTDPPYIPDTALLRSNTSKLAFHNDAGEFFFGYTPAFDSPNVSLKSFGSGNWVFQKDQSFSSVADDGNVLQVLNTQSIHGSSPLLTVYDDADNTVFAEVASDGFFVEDSGGVDYSLLAPAQLTLSDPVFENIVTSQNMQIQNFSTNDIFNVDTTIANFVSGADPNINSNWSAGAINFFSDTNTPITTSNLGAFGLTVQVVAAPNASTVVGADYIQLFDGVSNTVNVNPNNINCSDGTNQSFIGFDYGKISGALSALPFATLDVYGSIATVNPVTGLLDSAWQMGDVTAGAAVLDAANYIPVQINGIAYKLALIV
jgi:hypothetical protein